MWQLIWQKLTHKKWMAFCLLLGNCLLIAVCVSFPLYKEAALKRMLSDDFVRYIETENKEPGQVTGSLYSTGLEERDAFFQALSEAGQLMDGFPLPKKAEYILAWQAQTYAGHSREKADQIKIALSTLRGLSENAVIISGTGFHEAQVPEGSIPVLVTEDTLISQKLAIGDTLYTKNVKNENKEMVSFTVIGTFAAKEGSGSFWLKTPDQFDASLFLEEEAFKGLYENGLNSGAALHLDISLVADCEVTTPKTMEKVKQGFASLTDKLTGKGFKVTHPSANEIFEAYTLREKRIISTLLILEVPVLLLLCAFIYMISSQMFSMETAEISLMKSRGASVGQIFLLYTGQALILVLAGLVTGLVLGMFLCRVIGSANAFLEFVQRRNLKTGFTGEVFLYGGIACLLSLLMMILPAISLSRLSIVKARQTRFTQKKALWEKLGLDIIALIASLYGFSRFQAEKQEMIRQMMSSKALDPLLYLCSSLFILGAGLFLVRLRPLILKLIYNPLKKGMKPESYASFLQMIRTYRKQHFIQLFLMLTVALGIYDATVARTILTNAEENTQYLSGTDVKLSERWRYVLYQDGTKDYIEADFAKWSQIPGLISAARVFTTEGNVSPQRGGFVEDDVALLGIETRDFGLSLRINDKERQNTLYTLLNVLAKEPEGAIVSANFQTEKNVNAGDRLTITTGSGKLSVKVVGFFEEFPAYQAEKMVVNRRGEAVNEQQYEVITHLALMHQNLPLEPYDIWLSFKNQNTAPLYQFLEEKKIDLVSFNDTALTVKNIRKDTLFQGTNGILTMSFIVILLMCAAGFLIYWILSIKEREMLFGVFRAMGMKKQGIFHMLILEQIFSSGYALIVGTGLGFLVSKMFVPFLCAAYAAGDQVLPLKMVTSPADMLKLFTVILIVLLVALFALTRLVFSMKITNALKLGED